MKPTALVVVFLFLLLSILGACAGWQVTANKTLVQMHRIGGLAHDELTNDVCRSVIEECKELRKAYKEEPCDALKACQDRRRRALQSVDSLQRSVMLGLIALQVADQPKVDKAIAGAVAALDQVRKALETWGVKL